MVSIGEINNNSDEIGDIESGRIYPNETINSLFQATWHVEFC